MIAITEKIERPEINHPRLSEALGILLLALSMTMLFSLLSYDPLDPAWNVVTGRTQTMNWIGAVGAWISDFLFQIFGLSAFLMPILLTTIGWRTLRLRQLQMLHRRFLGLMIMIVAVAGLLSLPQMPLYRDNVRFGGAVGYLLAQLLEFQLNKIGSGIILGLILIFALMLATEFSFNALFESAGARTLVEWIVATEMATRRQWHRLRVGWREQQQARAQAKAEKRAAVAQARAEKEAREQAERIAREKEALERAAREKLELELREKEAREREAKELREREARAIQAAAVNKTQLPQPPVEAISETFIPTPVVNERVNPSRLMNPSRPLRQTGRLDANNRSATAPLGNNRRGSERDLNELRRLVYGEEVEKQPIEEFSLSGAVDKLEVKQELKEVDEINKRNNSGRVPVLSRRSDTARVPKISSKPPAPVNQHIDPAIDKMLESASIERKAEEDDEIPPPPAYLPTPLTNFNVPDLGMLNTPPPRQEQQDEELWERARLLAEKCKEFSVSGKIQHINPGPVVTTFEFKPDPGVKYSRVTSLVDDLCLALKAESIRIDRIPGKSTVGIEVPNINREVIYLREICESEKYQNASSPLSLALGKTIDGKTYVADLTKMPHLLIAGATGTGKSVCLNSVIVSILCKASPDEVKMIMVDPKRLELGLYEGIPHLLTPIVLEPKRASNALKWAVGEMENRYKMLAGHGVRNIEQYNHFVRQKHEEIPAIPDDELPQLLPFIVIIIDELADLMMVASTDVETSITRLAQMARAVGIHLIIATQRPSVDVITGLIKANFPSRISFRVSSKVDSRTILDTNGAETLLGQGDMLFLPPGTSRLVRVHGAYVNEAEIGRIVDFIRQQKKPDYNESIQYSDEEAEVGEGGIGNRDELYDEALKIICQMGRASTSVLQRRLRIGYGRAAAILDMMELEGFVGPSDGSKPRVVKQVAYDYVDRLEQHGGEDF